MSEFSIDEPLEHDAIDDRKILAALELDSTFGADEKELLKYLFSKVPEWHRTLTEVYTAIIKGQESATATEQIKKNIDDWMNMQFSDYIQNLRVPKADLELLKLHPRLLNEYTTLRRRFIEYHLANKRGQTLGGIYKKFKHELDKVLRDIHSRINRAE